MENLHRDINNSFFMEECMEYSKVLNAGCSETQKASTFSPPAAGRKKRKLPASKNGGAVKPETENQRITHIVVERNRRRLMNEHLLALRSIMPSSFVQRKDLQTVEHSTLRVSGSSYFGCKMFLDRVLRGNAIVNLVSRGDQASIIGGAIDFVKELEQMLFSLRAEKSCRLAAAPEEVEEEEWLPPAATGGFFVAPQYAGYSWGRRRGEEEREVDVEATAVQGHVNLKVAGRRRPGQLVRAIAAMEELRLTVLHLSITCLDQVSVLYSLNLKMEEECRLGSADEIATAVHRIFSFITTC